MELTNGTGVQEFILLGFGMDQEKQFLLFAFLIILYVLTLVENSTIITVVHIDGQLSQLPMYILLSNFSWLEICYVTTSIPRLLFDLATQNQAISFHACFFQFYIFFSLGNTEFSFLSALALDRYLAICHPLRYPNIVSQNFCYRLIAGCWLVGFLEFLLPVVLISKLSFCGDNSIDHFICDPVPILSLACPPLGKAPLVMQISMQTLFLVNVFFVIFSYGNVIYTLMKSFSKSRCRKGFSTISMHLLVVALFYGTVGAMYVIPHGESHPNISKSITLFYTAVTPFVNPLIYCLRNDKVKEALGKLLRRMIRFLLKKTTVEIQ
ncbi:olfactory receptor 11G2-like [Protobothrops mucrosquamatus]|uniref:olfactory receptor 11G2-like n=1 Tax=Protobothrops mucrosquamatus TaxID=103944 RepID=UPI000775E380|nr:olfactory receptor 11G2-like [Protobothrops mucrosquamatus]